MSKPTAVFAPLPPGTDPRMHLRYWIQDLHIILRGSRTGYATGPSNQPLHPAVAAMIDLGWRPADWHRLVLEWPTHSSDLRLAYWANERKMGDGVRTVTTAGKYLARVFCGCPDHIIRDVVAANSAARFELLHDMGAFLRAMEVTTAGSCMTGDDFDSSVHPYTVYDPNLGWRMAVRFDAEDNLVGRGLWLHPSCGPWAPGESTAGGIFVRTFCREVDSDSSYSYADTAMEHWLTHDCGMLKHGAWPSGTRLALVVENGMIVAPYVDGGRSSANMRGDTLVLCDGGRYELRDTNGYAEFDGAACSHCGGVFDSDDLSGVGRYGDDLVCDSCLSDHYTYAVGAGGESYYVLDHEVVYTPNDDAYVARYLSDNDMVQLDDGNVYPIDDVFRCPIDDEWYHVDEGRCVEDLQETVHDSNAWQCAESGAWYSTNVTPVEIDGQEYHPDHAPEPGADQPTEQLPLCMEATP